jgi:hypothetical protein
MLWHAESGFRFRLIGGHFGLRVTPRERKWGDVYEALGTGRLQPRRLCMFLATHGVDAVVVTPRTSWRMRRTVRAAVAHGPLRAFNADVYDLRGGRCASSGGEPSDPREPTSASGRPTSGESIRYKG